MEAIRVTLVITLLKMESEILTVTIYIDNQSIITSTDINKPRPGQYILNEFHRIADLLQENPH
jgi:hypothetical protein